MEANRMSTTKAADRPTLARISRNSGNMTLCIVDRRPLQRQSIWDASRRLCEQFHKARPNKSPAFRPSQPAHPIGSAPRWSSQTACRGPAQPPRCVSPPALFRGFPNLPTDERHLPTAGIETNTGGEFATEIATQNRRLVRCRSRIYRPSVSRLALARGFPASCELHLD